MTALQSSAVTDPITQPATPPSGTPDERFSTYVVPEIEVLYRVARSITGNPTDAEDLVQDTLLRSYRAIERFDGRHPRAWLLTIMRNAQINRVRRKRPQLMRDPDLTMQTTADTSADSVDIEAQVMHDTFDERIETALAALAPKFREVVELVDVNGLSYQEAAEALDVPVGTIMSRLHRARKRVRSDLESAGLDLRTATGVRPKDSDPDA